MRVSSVAIVVGLAACATAPRSPSGREDLQASADATLSSMMHTDPGLADMLDSSYGYAVFPEIGKGGLIVGGARGRGIAYEHGKPVGFVSLSQLSLGAQLGAQTFAELVVFNTREGFEQLQRGTFTVGANASIVALTTGAAAAADLNKPTIVFVQPRGGLMVEASISGEVLNYQPLRG